MSEAGPDERPGSTIPDVPSLPAERRNKLIRRATLLVLLVFVLAGLSGALGVRKRTVTGDAGPDLHASLSYAAVARPALAIPYHLEIRRAGGFDTPIEVRITTTYLAALDENGTEPEPSEATTDADETIWTFDPPDGDVLAIWLDTRVEPGVQWRRRGRTTIVVGDQTIALDHDMWILP